MAYRSVLGAYSKPRALLSVSYPRATDLHFTVFGSTQVLDYSGDAQQSSLPRQIVNVSNNPSSYVGANSFAINIEYNTSTADRTLSGVGFRVHYDSSKLSLLSVENTFNNSFLTGDYGDFNDTDDFDNDTSTDKYIQLKWLSSGDFWPSDNVSLPLQLATLNFSVSDDAAARGNTPLNLTPVSTSSGYVFKSENFPLEISFISWDIDENGQVDALTDGLLYLRYLFGLRGSDFYAGAVAPDVIISVEDIEANTQRLTETIGDIDGSGSVDALTDALLLLRYLFGLRGDALISNAVALNATRTSASQIESYIENFFPAEEIEIPDDVFVQKASTRAILEAVKPKTTLSVRNIESLVSLTKSSVTVDLPEVKLKSSATAVQSLINYIEPKQSLQYINIAASDFELLLENLISKSLSSAFDIGDTQKLSIFKNVTDQLGLADAASISTASGLTDSFEFGDEATLAAVYNRPETDNVSVGDQPHLSLSKPALDSIGMSELASLLFTTSKESSLGISDTSELSFTAVKNDTAEVQDNHSYTYSSLKQDTQTTFESFANYLNLKRSFASGFTLEDQASTDGGIDKTNLFGIGDEAFLFADYTRPATESVGIADLLSSSLTKSLLDAQQTFESISKFSYYKQKPSESVGIHDKLSYSGTFAKSDTVQIQELNKLSLTKGTSDSQTVTESLARYSAFTRNLESSLTVLDDIDIDNITGGFDVFGFSEKVNLTAIYERLFSSPLDVVEQIHLNLTKPVSDSQSVTELFKSNIYYREKEQDGVEISDIATLATGLNKADLVSFTDLASLDVSKPLTDSQTAAELFKRYASYKRAASSTFGIDDAVNVDGDFGQERENIFGINDEAVLTATYNRTRTDAFGFDSETFMDITKAAADSQSATEIFTKLVNYRHAATDNLSFADIASLSTNKLVSENIGISEKHGFMLDKVVADTQALSEDFSRYSAFIRKLSDSIELIDNDNLSASNLSIDSFGFKDVAKTAAIYNRPRTSSLQVLELLGIAVTKPAEDSLGTFYRFNKFGYYKESVADTLTLTDSDTYSLDSSDTDSASLTDEASFSLSKPASDAQSVFEAFEKYSDYKRYLSSSFSLIDNTNISNSNSNVSGLGVSDKVTTSTTFNRKPNEPISIQEFVGKGVTKALQDTQQTFESFNKLIGYKNIESDALSFSDQPFLHPQKNQSANISMVDSVEISTVKSAVELVTSQESVFIGKHYLRSQSSSITLTDEDNLQNKTSPLESVGFIEDVDLIITFLRKPTENISILEATNFSLSADKSDTFDASERLIKNIYYKESFSETIGIDDFNTVESVLDNNNLLSVVDVPSLLLTKPATDSFSPSEELKAHFAYQRSLSDSFGFDEVVDIPYSTSAAKSDSFGFTEQVTLSTSLEINRTETLGVNDELNYTLSKPLNNTQNTSENISKLIYYKGSASDSIGFTETVTTTLTTVESSRTVNSSAINSAEIN